MQTTADIVRIHPGRKRSITSNAHLLYRPDFVPPENLVQLSARRAAPEPRPFPTHALLAALIATMPLDQYRLFSGELRQAIVDDPSRDNCRNALSWAAILWKALH